MNRRGVNAITRGRAVWPRLRVTRRKKFSIWIYRCQRDENVERLSWNKKKKEKEKYTNGCVCTHRPPQNQMERFLTEQPGVVSVPKLRNSSRLARNSATAKMVPHRRFPCSRFLRALTIENRHRINEISGCVRSSFLTGNHKCGLPS